MRRRQIEYLIRRRVKLDTAQWEKNKENAIDW